MLKTSLRCFFVFVTILFYFRVNKNCLKWAQNYFTEQLVGLEAEKNGNTASITKMVECTGDVDLNQRKGKIITIYDVVLKLNWKGKIYAHSEILFHGKLMMNIGTLADGTEVTGSLNIPEVAHDTDSDDYVVSYFKHQSFLRIFLPKLSVCVV